MVITNPEIKRLNYVERELSLLNDSHLAKVVHNVIENIKSSPEYVYVLAITIDTHLIIECYENFQEAVNRMTHHIKYAQIKFYDEFSSEQVAESPKRVDPELGTAYYSIWALNDPIMNNTTIEINRKEVK